MIGVHAVVRVNGKVEKDEMISAPVLDLDRFETDHTLTILGQTFHIEAAYEFDRTLVPEEGNGSEIAAVLRDALGRLENGESPEDDIRDALKMLKEDA